jgi:hypothetical protein
VGFLHRDALGGRPAAELADDAGFKVSNQQLRHGER